MTSIAGSRCTGPALGNTCILFGAHTGWSAMTTRLTALIRTRSPWSTAQPSSARGAGAPHAPRPRRRPSWVTRTTAAPVRRLPWRVQVMTAGTVWSRTRETTLMTGGRSTGPALGNTCILFGAHTGWSAMTTRLPQSTSTQNPRSTARPTSRAGTSLATAEALLPRRRRHRLRRRRHRLPAQARRRHRLPAQARRRRARALPVQARRRRARALLLCRRRHRHRARPHLMRQSSSP